MPNRHAYLVIAHHEAEVLRCQLRLLDYPGNDIYLHIDAHAVDMRSAFAKWRPRHAGYQLVERPLHAGWGGYNMVRVEMMLLRLAHVQGPYARYHVLSGVDLPIKSQQAIHAFFAAHPHREYVSFWTTPEHNRDLRRKVRYYYLFNEHLKDKHSWKHRLTTPVRKISLVIQKALFLRRRGKRDWRKGSVWVSITEDFCAYLVSRMPQVLALYRYLLCADEIFLQTELWNSPFRERVELSGSLEEESMRLIDWQRGYPYVWKYEDVDELRQSSCLFARKFSGNDTRLLEAVTQMATQ